ncbi:mediator of RNA polymerase II transcription subunit 1 [Diaphorina citri]|uniref:Mediator of RNA polymerase II transcription subunit 1 n=1 Tax=Diaphorina citri TaxID=121845 RepID=A0A3Q0IR54_DIACI|nr:mediator of RNA polymerase II transcription subunit 1 [Diaphorina citri]
MSSSGTPVDKAKQVQCDMLMEKLKNKASQYKSFFDMAKALRMTILEKRYAIDNVERSQLQKCLDLLQQSIKVNSLQAMVERLESISRQLGLKFMAGQSGFDWFISSDMFYLEVVLEASGNVKDVKIHHEGRDQQSCEELIQCLQNQDFNDFTVQLESLTSIYQLNAEKKVKSKAFAALQSLEADLITLASLQTNIKDPFLLIHKSPVGALHKRRGGHAMMLTYFVSPYDLLDLKNKISKPLSADSVDVGFSVTVSMESSCAHKLQITTLVTVSVNPSGKNTPVYGASTPQNTASLPACFVLKLNKPTPMCVSLVKKIQAVTEMECSTVDTATPKPLLSLIIQHQADKSRDSTSNKPLFVRRLCFTIENRTLKAHSEALHCSSKSDSSKKSSSSKDFQSGREKDKKLSSSSSGNSSHSSPKLKPPTVKMKPDVLEDLDPSKGDPSQMRKKGSLSAVIDKLKSAQHGGEPGSGEGGKESSQVKSTSMSSKTSDGKVTSSGKSEVSSKIPGEYQVKHSSDGMKITINKTKTLTKIAKPSSSSPKFTGLSLPTLSSSSGSSTSTGGSSSSKISSSSGSSSSSGVTGSSTSSSSSKLSSSSSSSSSKSSSPSLSTKSNFKTSSSSSSSSSKGHFKTSSSSSSSSSSSLSKSGGSSDLTKQRDKMKLSSKSSSGSNSPSLSSSDKSKKSSEDYKSSIQLSSQHVVEGLVKQLDTKFQIPKLSARSSESNPTGSSTVNTTSSSTSTLSSSDSSSSKKPDTKPSYQSSSETKSIDPLPSNKLPDSSSKYPVVLASPLKFEEKMMEPVKSSSRSLTSSPVQCASPTKFSSKSCDATSFDEKLNPSATSDALKSLKMDLPIGGISFSDAEIKKPLPLANAKPTDKPVKAGTTSQEAAEMLLDFSSATQATKPPDPGPGKLIKQPPSQVSLHIVKSPVPSPSPKLVNSPSPALIDDELVDDNLVGIGK